MAIVTMCVAVPAISAVLWKVARGRVRTYWIVLAAFVGTLTGMLAARIAAMPDTARSSLVAEIAAAAVTVSWWLVARGAMRDRMERDRTDDGGDGGRWYLDD